jgi:hypothetical protein
MNNIDNIGANELVFNSSDGINSGGFSVNSIMMKAGMSPIMTVNNQSGGSSNKVSDLFESLVIPNWALSYNTHIGGGENAKSNNDDDSSSDEEKFEEEEEESDEDISDDLHDKLLNLVKEHEAKLNQPKKIKKTRKHKLKKTRKSTRRH